MPGIESLGRTLLFRKTVIGFLRNNSVKLGNELYKWSSINKYCPMLIFVQARYRTSLLEIEQVLHGVVVYRFPRARKRTQSVGFYLLFAAVSSICSF